MSNFEQKRARTGQQGQLPSIPSAMLHHLSTSTHKLAPKRNAVLQFFSTTFGNISVNPLQQLEGTKTRGLVPNMQKLGFHSMLP